MGYCLTMAIAGIMTHSTEAQRIKKEKKLGGPQIPTNADSTSPA